MGTVGDLVSLEMVGDLHPELWKTKGFVWKRVKHSAYKSTRFGKSQRQIHFCVSSEVGEAVT